MAVLWEQWIDGFDSTTTETGCTIDVDSAAPFPDTNKITATIQSANDAEDRATGNETTLASLPQNDEGRLRFKFRTPVTFSLLANSTIVLISNAVAGAVIDLYITSAEKIGCFSSATTLQSASLNQAGATVLSADTEYTVEVAWKGATDATGFRRVWLNDVLEFETINLDMVAADDCDAAEMRLGIDHYDGGDASGWQAKIRMAQLSDDAAVQLTDPPSEPTHTSLPRRGMAMVG